MFWDAIHEEGFLNSNFTFDQAHSVYRIDLHFVLTLIRYIEVDFMFELPVYASYNEEFVISRFHSIQVIVTLAGLKKYCALNCRSLNRGSTVLPFFCIWSHFAWRTDPSWASVLPPFLTFQNYTWVSENERMVAVSLPSPPPHSTPRNTSVNGFPQKSGGSDIFAKFFYWKTETYYYNNYARPRSSTKAIWGDFEMRLFNQQLFHI